MINPLSLIENAIRAVPAVKYALGIAGVISVIAVVRALQIDFRVAVFGAIIIIVLMVLLLVFARLSATGTSAAFARPSMFLVWSSMLLTVGSAFLMASSVFFRWPINLQDWLLVHTDRKPTNNTLSSTLPANISFRNAARVIAEEYNSAVVFPGCLNTFLDTKLRGGPLKGSGAREILEALQTQLPDNVAFPRYRVVHIKEKGTYEIQCES